MFTLVQDDRRSAMSGSTTMGIQEQDKKWRGSVVEILNAPVDQVWAIFADFDGFQRHFPSLFSSCRTVEGVVNHPGSLRVRIAHPYDETPPLFAKERLLTLDHKNHTMSYAMEENNLCWTGYRTYFAAEDFGAGQTRVKWSYEKSPTPYQTPEEFDNRVKILYLSILQMTREKFPNWRNS